MLHITLLLNYIIIFFIAKNPNIKLRIKTIETK
jgi:hypothetical protein